MAKIAGYTAYLTRLQLARSDHSREMEPRKLRNLDRSLAKGMLRKVRDGGKEAVGSRKNPSYSCLRIA